MGAWALEVVRGREPGRVFPVGVGESVLGNTPADRPGLDLSGQESDGAIRRMAPRHAAIDCLPGSITLRDLESPGGTFVNRRRVLPGRAEPLRAGDVIQLGGVQLRVIADGGPVNRPAPTPAPFAFAMAGGSTCRSWDDFLALSAQRWGALRDELGSGRLSAFLAAVGRVDLLPPPDSGDPDARLDAWLATLPTSKSAVPELDVHPSRLVVRATPGGGTIRRSVRVANVGYRLLRSTARVEPPGASWLAVAPEFATRAFATVEETELAVEVIVPDAIPHPLSAELVIEGNGGSKRVAVILEAKSAPIEPAEAGPAPPADWGLAALIARQSPPARVATWALAALAARLLIGVAGGSIGEDAMTASGPDSPSLGRVALVLAALMGSAGCGLIWRRGGGREAVYGLVAGSGVGVVAASGLVASCRSIEPILGAWSTSVLAVCLLWAAIGSALAALASPIGRRIEPPRRRERQEGEEREERGK